MKLLSSRDIQRWRESLSADTTVSGEGECPPAETLWAHAGGQAEPGDDVLAHVFSCGACAAAWRAARELQQEGDGEALPLPRMSVSVRWALAAAAILAALAIPVLLLRAPAREPVFRSVEGPEIVDASPAVLSRDSFTLEWSGAPEGSTYDVRVMTADLAELTAAFRLREPRLHVTADSLSELAPGDVVLWQVTSYLPDGRQLVSLTFSTTLR